MTTAIWTLKCGMLGSEILDFFKQHPVLHKHVKFILAADQLRSLHLPNRTAAVVNVDRLSGRGSHWYTVAKLENRFGKRNGLREGAT